MSAHRRPPSALPVTATETIGLAKTGAIPIHRNVTQTQCNSQSNHKLGYQLASGNCVTTTTTATTTGSGQSHRTAIFYLSRRRNCAGAQQRRQDDNLENAALGIRPNNDKARGGQPFNLIMSWAPPLRAFSSQTRESGSVSQLASYLDLGATQNGDFATSG